MVRALVAVPRLVPMRVDPTPTSGGQVGYCVPGWHAVPCVTSRVMCVVAHETSSLRARPLFGSCVSGLAPA